MLTRLVGNAGLQFKQVNFGYEQQIAAELVYAPCVVMLSDSIYLFTYIRKLKKLLKC